MLDQIFYVMYLSVRIACALGIVTEAAPGLRRPRMS